jgi:hypothetical protein
MKIHLGKQNTFTDTKVKVQSLLDLFADGKQANILWEANFTVSLPSSVLLTSSDDSF